MNNLLNLKSFLKFLGRNKAYTTIDVFGLSVSLMFVLLIAVYTVQEMSTDNFQEKGDRVYVVGNEGSPAVGAAIAYKIKERYPEVEKVCPMVSNNFPGQKVMWGDKKLKGDLLFADSTFFDFFSFPLVRGDKDQVLAAMDNAVVSESFARKMFGTEDPVGKRLLVSDTMSVVVSGVVKDMLHSAISPADLIIRWQLVGSLNPSLAPDQLGNAGSTCAFVLAREGSDFASRADEMRDWFKTFFWIYERDIWKEVRIMPLKEVYFSGWGNGYPLRNGDRRFVLVLMSVGILILIFAVINYINLTVAQAGFRAKEMATRRLLGSSRVELFLRLIMESTLLTFISLVIGILLALFVTPFVNDLLQTQLDLSVLLSASWLMSLLAVVLLVGGLSGLLPAAIISSSKPIEVVRGSFRAKTKMVFSKFFIVFQNTITITMIAVSIVMVAQINHMIKAPLGYNTDNLIASSSVYNEGQLNAYVNELRGLPFVKQVGKARGLPLFGSNNWTAIYEDRNISFQQFILDKECFEMLGLKILRDNKLTSLGWFLSEQAMQEMNLPEDATSFTLKGNDPMPIAGIIRNFSLGNITSESHPVMFRFLKDKEMPWMILIETQGDPFMAQKEIGRVYEKVTGLDYEGYFMDERLRNSYDSQIRLAKIVIVFSVIAILISLLGLLAMSTYFIQQRSREVSVRKVFGSSDGQILRKLVFTFLNYVLIAFVIAIPIIIYFMRKWLSDYSYRIELSPWIFVAAGLFCLLVSFISVFFQSYRAATSNPVDSFRNGQ